jgi:hypothetical protein
MIWAKRMPSELVISDSDLDAALGHLRTLPGSVSGALPYTWSKKRLVDLTREAIGPRPKIDDFKQVAPGVWALVKPFGVDLKDWDESDDRLQVWLLLRTVGTDSSRLLSI